MCCYVECFSRVLIFLFFVVCVSRYLGFVLGYSIFVGVWWSTARGEIESMTVCSHC